MSEINKCPRCRRVGGRHFDNCDAAHEQPTREGEEWWVDGKTTIRKRSASFDNWIGQVHEDHAQQIVHDHQIAALVSGLVEALRDIRQWLIMPSSDGIERTAWPERVAVIDTLLNAVAKERER